MVQVKLSQYYDKVNTAVYYRAVQLYLHALSVTSLDGDVPLNPTPSDSPTRKNQR